MSSLASMFRAQLESKGIPPALLDAAIARTARERRRSDGDEDGDDDDNNGGVAGQADFDALMANLAIEYSNSAENATPEQLKEKAERMRGKGNVEELRSLPTRDDESWGVLVREEYVEENNMRTTQLENRRVVVHVVKAPKSVPWSPLRIPDGKNDAKKEDIPNSKHLPMLADVHTYPIEAHSDPIAPGAHDMGRAHDLLEAIVSACCAPGRQGPSIDEYTARILPTAGIPTKIHVDFEGCGSHSFVRDSPGGPAERDLEQVVAQLKEVAPQLEVVPASRTVGTLLRAHHAKAVRDNPLARHAEKQKLHRNAHKKERKKLEKKRAGSSSSSSKHDDDPPGWLPGDLPNALEDDTPRNWYAPASECPWVRPGGNLRSRLMWGWRTKLEEGVRCGNATVVSQMIDKHPRDDVLEFCEARILLQKLVLAASDYPDSGPDGSINIKLERDWVGTAKVLLDAGEPADGRDTVHLRQHKKSSGDLGSTPLYVAAELGHHKLAKLFLKRGADPHKLNHAGISPVFIADCRGLRANWKCRPLATHSVGWEDTTSRREVRGGNGSGYVWCV